MRESDIEPRTALLMIGIPVTIYPLPDGGYEVVSPILICCRSTGGDIGEALASFRAVANDWIEAVIAQTHKASPPPPTTDNRRHPPTTTDTPQ